MLAVVGACFDSTPESELTNSTAQAIAPTPTNVQAVALSPTRVRVTWDAVGGASQYIVMYGPTSGSETNLTTVSTTQYETGHIAPATQSCWQVKSIVGAEISTPSTEVCVTTPSASGAPADLAAFAASATRINLTWSAITNATKYYVYRSTTSNGTYNFIATVNATPTPNVGVTGLSPATTYFFRVATQFDGGVSAQSNPPVSATTFTQNGLEGFWAFDEDGVGTTANDQSGFNRHGALVGATGFSNNKAPILDNKSTIAFGGGANDAVTVPHTTAFNLQSSPGNGIDFTVALWVNLPNAPSGTVRLMGKRAAACGSAASWELAQDTTNQLHFRGASIASFGTTLPLSTWTHVAAVRANGTLTMYINGAQVATAAYNVGNANTAPLQIGNSGSCGSGGSALLDDVKIYSRALSPTEISTIGTIPPAPVNVVATVNSPTKITLTWNAVAGAQKYFVYQGSPGNTVFVTSHPTTTWENGHLAPGTQYAFQVATVRNNLISLKSVPEATATTSTAPPAPTGLMATAVSSSRINLSWSAVPTASKYYLYSSTTGGPPYTFVGSAPGTTFAHTPLSANTTYTYVVHTVGNDGVTESVDSSPASATTFP